jgi:hypothetical protein
MNINATIAALSEVKAPSEGERDASKMTAQQIEEAILNIVGALRHFDALIEILQRADFKDGDRQKAETATALVLQRIEWGLQVLMGLKPVN